MIQSMKKTWLLFAALLVCYAVLITPFTNYMRLKPFAEKLGHLPRAEFLRLVSADQKQLVGASLVMKVLFYFGTLVDKSQNKLQIPPDYRVMSQTIHGAVKLDPYNMDAYYFAQAVLVWDVKQVRIANELLEYGMHYRYWDFYLPFFAGFNNAYFLKDYAAAAKYYKRAAELTGDQLHVSLAGRYLQESGQTPLAIAYLSTMLRNERNQAVKKTYQLRLEAFKAARQIEVARDRFRSERERMPSSVEELLQFGFLNQIPVDPYRGKFYIDSRGQVNSTSKFAFGALGGEPAR